MKDKNNYLVLLINLCLISNCSLLKKSDSVKTTHYQSNVKPTTLPFNTKNTNSSKSLTVNSTNNDKLGKKIIKESRVSGQVTKIKVENGKYLPDYYIYPSEQKKLNINYGPDKDLAPPTWQISW